MRTFSRAPVLFCSIAQVEATKVEACRLDIFRTQKLSCCGLSDYSCLSGYTRVGGAQSLESDSPPHFAPWAVQEAPV